MNQMRTSFFLALTLVLSLESLSQGGFYCIISGTSTGGAKKVYIKYTIEDAGFVDSVTLRRNVFYFKKRFPLPVEASIHTDKSHKPAPVFLENGSYSMLINKDSIQIVKSPPTQQQYRQLLSIRESGTKLYSLYAKYSQENDSIGLKYLSVQFDSINKSSASLATRMFQNNPKTAMALFLFEKFASSKSDYAENESDFKKLPAWAKASKRGVEIAEVLAGAKKARIGMMAPLFTQKDTANKQVSLASFRGKYVLIDFWASWCKPCREENPNLVKAYEEFNAKGLEIIGVSLENKGDFEKWMRAIRKDNLRWTHVSSFQFFNEPVARIYGVQTIPQNFLIDPQGRIVAKNLKGDALFQKLRTLLP